MAHTATDRKRTLLVVDAACDLPTQWLRLRDVCMLPIAVQVDDWSLIDSHDEFDTSEFFTRNHSCAGRTGSDGASSALSEPALPSVSPAAVR